MWLLPPSACFLFLYIFRRRLARGCLFFSEVFINFFFTVFLFLIFLDFNLNFLFTLCFYRIVFSFLFVHWPFLKLIFTLIFKEQPLFIHYKQIINVPWVQQFAFLCQCTRKNPKCLNPKKVTADMWLTHLALILVISMFHMERPYCHFEMFEPNPELMHGGCFSFCTWSINICEMQEWRMPIYHFLQPPGNLSHSVCYTNIVSVRWPVSMCIYITFTHFTFCTL